MVSYYLPMHLMILSATDNEKSGVSDESKLSDYYLE